MILMKLINKKTILLDKSPFPPSNSSNRHKTKTFNTKMEEDIIDLHQRVAQRVAKGKKNIISENTRKTYMNIN